MPVLAVIPARLGATRLPNKPLRLLGGVPLVARVWERVVELGDADAVVVATDDQRISDSITQRGGRAVLTRADHPSGTDRVAEVAALGEFASFDIILNVQGDEPFVSSAAIRGALRMVRSGLPIGTAAAPADHTAHRDPTVVKVVCADDGRALYFSRAPIPFLRDAVDHESIEGRILQHVGVYAYHREALTRWVSLPIHALERIERLEQLRPLAAGLAIGVAIVEETLVPGIDTEDDLARANARWASVHACP